MGNKNDIRRNGFGYYDPTAYQAIVNVTIEEERLSKLLSAILSICESSGFSIEGPIVLKDAKTGRIWRKTE